MRWELGIGRALPQSSPPPLWLCVGSVQPTRTQSGKPSTSECQVAISKAGQSLCTLPVFFPESNLRKDDTANQLLVCLGILQRANKSLRFLEKRKNSSPCMLLSLKWRTEFICHLFLFSFIPIPHQSSKSCWLHLIPKSWKLSSCPHSCYEYPV